jgi:hypothetical protein
VGGAKTAAADAVNAFVWKSFLLHNPNGQLIPVWDFIHRTLGRFANRPYTHRAFTPGRRLYA